MCPGSAIAEKDRPGTTSQAAADGTRKHEIMERIMQSGKESYNQILGSIDPDDRPDIEEAVDLFDRLCEMHDLQFTHVEFEKKVKIPELSGVWGTTDVLGRAVDKTGPVGVVVDWKFGHKKVAAEGNIQLGFYALNAIAEHPDTFAGIDRWLVAIVQPAHGLSYWYTDRAWLEYLTKLVKTADGKIEAGVDERQAGTWCHYCKGAATCGALRYTSSALAMAPTDLNSITIAEGLQYIEELEDRVSALGKAIRARANDAAASGQPIPGWKMVEKLGNREWSVSDKEVLDAIPEATRIEVASPTQVEKALGKKAFKERAEQFVTRKVAGLTLVREADRRPAVTPKGSLSETLGLGPEDRIL